MTISYGDRVQETFSTTGTGAITLAGAITGYQAFSAILSTGATCYYAATDGVNWEVGIGTYTSSGNTLARTTILSSSNGNAAVNWPAGVKNIWLDLPASLLALLNNLVPMTAFGGGSLALLAPTATNTAVVAGTNYAGSSLAEVNLALATTSLAFSLAGNPAGTWVALNSSAAQSGKFSVSLFQRVA